MDLFVSRNTISFHVPGHIVGYSSHIFTLVQVLDRGEKIELLVDKTETLHHQVISYY